ncbi:cytochrome c oxidase assembly protein [Allosphingosinicella vermicomposti]|uniref:cytochrome c oxidase assembly protein n=1 Tax=Allosphingosinicella vermicomposti TaxID=614671 RepID=UPI000D0F25D3|nr:cytochrome c oxidase assembly protein [Allosphingosinicella vermicomposti]
MTTLAQKNGRTAAMAALAVIMMVGLAFAAVPLYRVFCQVTGFGGTTMKVSESEVPKQALGRVLSIRFDSNTSSALPWQFHAEKATDKAAIGARKMAFFVAKNLSDKPVTGTATFNVTPLQAGQYFSKVQCFCFTEQTLQPGQEMRMPVVYFVDPKIMDDPDASKISEITLSYTFYPVDDTKPQS